MSDPRAANAATQITELKVSGHTMVLEPGMYCIFNAPGGGAPDPSTGLPIVRISAAPGVGPGRIKTVGLEAEGWIGPDSATLVRVTDARADLLVTVYQAPNSRIDAPSIQVVRLGGDDSVPAGAAARSASRPVAARPAAGQATGTGAVVEVVSHIYGLGDVGGMLGAWVGEPGSKRWIEGFNIAPVNGVPAADVEYQAVLGRGWLSPWSEGGQFCGSRGMSLPILGLRVRLRGPSAATHRVVLQASFVDGAKVGPVGDAEACEAPSLAALEAFQLSFDPIVAQPVPAPAKPRRTGAGGSVPVNPVAKKAAQKMTAKTVPAERPAPSKPASSKPGTRKPVASKPAAPAPIAAEPVVPVAAPPARRAPGGRRR